MAKKRLQYRMYGFVPYNLSPIQQGIQFGHGAIEYWLKHPTPAFKSWAKHDKTFIILNGGTTNNNDSESGISTVTWELHKAKIPFAVFQEPDLNNATTAVMFLVDERVWDKKKYPLQPFELPGEGGYATDFDYKKWLATIGGEQNLFLRRFLQNYRLA